MGLVTVLNDSTNKATTPPMPDLTDKSEAKYHRFFAFTVWSIESIHMKYIIPNTSNMSLRILCNYHVCYATIKFKNMY